MKQGPACISIKANILIWPSSPSYFHIHYICGKFPGWMTITEVTKEKLVDHAPPPNSCLHKKSLLMQKLFTAKTNHHRCRPYIQYDKSIKVYSTTILGGQTSHLSYFFSNPFWGISYVCVFPLPWHFDGGSLLTKLSLLEGGWVELSWFLYLL